jgi:threonine dehydrogenase-like Zn-dependent dehydrogenase
MVGAVLSGGADVVIDAVGNASSLEDGLAITRPKGRLVVCGMPGVVEIDLAPLWHRETEMVGAYTYGTEELVDGTRAHTFALATELVESAHLDRLVSATYPLSQYKQALRHASEAGRRGAVKIAFDLRA